MEFIIFSIWITFFSKSFVNFCTDSLNSCLVVWICFWYTWQRMLLN